MKKEVLYVLATWLCTFSTIVLPAQTVSHFAGSGDIGSTDALGVLANFYNPTGIAVDANGNLYVADSDNHKIRKITPIGEVSTVAGTGLAGNADGMGNVASFNFPAGVAVDQNGNIYVADAQNNKIRKISTTGEVTTLAGSGIAGSADDVGIMASFKFPYGIAVDANGNVYVGDVGNHKIRKISAGGVVTTLAGTGSEGSADGNGTSASFNFPVGIAIGGNGNLYIADIFNNKIRMINASGDVTTFAGSGAMGNVNGTGTAAVFYSPNSISVDVDGNFYITEYDNHQVRKISSTGVVTNYAGSGLAGVTNGIGTAATFFTPTGIAVDANRNVYVADYGNNRIRKITPEALPITLLSFKAAVAGNYARLQWQTANEINNKGFECYRSSDDKQFVKIGEIAASALGNYSFTDKEPLKGNNYYKLLQIDNDGTATNLGIRTLSFGISTLGVRSFPSPIHAEFTVVSPIAQSATIINLSGQVIAHLKLEAGVNMFNSSLWPTGMYILKTATERTRLLKR